MISLSDSKFIVKTFYRMLYMSSYVSFFFFFFFRMIQGILFLQSNIYNVSVTDRGLEYAKLCSEKRRQEEEEKKRNSIL